jgi:hypothetical protein
MESGRTTREWLEGLDPAEFREVSNMISDIQSDRAEARREKLEQRRSAASERKAGNKRYLRLERVKCGKKGCKKCATGELHGPYWYLYRPKQSGKGRTSEYVGKVLPQPLAEEFGIQED